MSWADRLAACCDGEAGDGEAFGGVLRALRLRQRATQPYNRGDGLRVGWAPEQGGQQGIVLRTAGPTETCVFVLGWTDACSLRSIGGLHTSSADFV